LARVLGVRDYRFYCFVKEPPKMVLRRIVGPSLETGAVLDGALAGNFRTDYGADL